MHTVRVADAAALEAEARALEERAEACGRVARLHAAAEKVLREEAARLRAMLVNAPADTARFPEAA